MHGSFTYYSQELVFLFADDQSWQSYMTICHKPNSLLKRQAVEDTWEQN